jgi:hypothetical protein
VDLDGTGEQYGKLPEAGDLIVRAGLAAFPYLSRQGEWATGSAMLGQVERVDSGPSAIAAILPRMRRVVEATAGTDQELTDRGLLARFLLKAGRRQEAEQELRAVLERAVAREEFRLASTFAGDLANLLRDGGRYDEALRIIEQMADYTKRAGLGPWTQLADEGWRLQILRRRGEDEAVFRRVVEMRELMKTLPDPAGPNEAIPIWNVREPILNLGFLAASDLEEWQQALDFSREIQQSEQQRGAPSLERERTKFNNYVPLMGLKRYDEAGESLRACRDVFERENSIDALGKVFSALADLEDEMRRPATAQNFEETALRYKYAQSDPDAAAVSHFNISNYINKSQGEWREALAHRLAAVLIVVVMQSGRAVRLFAALVRDLRNAGPEGSAAFPADFAALCEAVEKIEGVRFREMIERLAGGPAECDELFRQVVASALEEASKPE